MSDYVDGGHYLDADHHAAELEHERYGHEHDHDAALHELHAAQAAEHDAHYQHGHHEEFDTPHTHYSETDYTNYSEHDAQAASYDELDAREHDFTADYADRLFAEEIHDHLTAFESGHDWNFSALRSNL